MKKILSILELQKSKWPGMLQQALGDNLISAFIHGDCLVEGFNALERPWTVSFILRENTTSSLKALQPLLHETAKENIEFRYFFTLKEIQTSEDVFPLEFLHIANRSVSLAGARPLPGYKPNVECLRLECERELRGMLIHLREAYMYLKQERNPLGFFIRANASLLPIMYGVYYLLNHTYPESHKQIFDQFPSLQVPASSRNQALFEESVNNYIATVTEIVNQVDSMDVV
ncbi:hypothetical protein [uncultured Fibrobacter sp.]|uniref:hypothetical protein n=1 Tax=uncultured Fibrobacter sp. TaxID=261512 RepID=UPI002621455A|nr:hypothetical protein [uncultured Fibrobacter sp.]